MGSAAGRIFLDPPYFSQRGVFASPLSVFFTCMLMCIVMVCRISTRSATVLRWSTSGLSTTMPTETQLWPSRSVMVELLPARPSEWEFQQLTSGSLLMLSDLMWTLYGFAYLFRSIAFGALSPLSGQQEGHLACKKNWVLVYGRWWSH